MRRIEFFPPHKMPIWFNRLRYKLTGHLGYWTQEEVDSINRRAKAEYEQLKDSFE